MTYDERDRLLGLDDAAMLALCRVTTTRGSGPGGQHRNTTDSAVRVILVGGPTMVLPEGTDIQATASENRSQHENRHRAIKRLRQAIAEGLRVDDPRPWNGAERVSAKNDRYPQFLASMLDALALCRWQVGETAAYLGTSTGRLARNLAADDVLWSRVQQERQASGLKALRRD